MMTNKPIVDRDQTLSAADLEIIERARKQREFVAMAEAMAASNSLARPKAA